MAAHSSIPAWSIPRTEEPGGLQSMESQGVGQDREMEHTVLKLCCFLFIYRHKECNIPWLLSYTVRLKFWFLDYCRMSTSCHVRLATATRIGLGAEWDWSGPVKFLLGSQSSGGGYGGCIANQQEFREPGSSLLVPQATHCGRQGTGHSRHSLLRKLKVWVAAGDQVFERLIHYNDLDIATFFFSVNEQHTVKWKYLLPYQ